MADVLARRAAAEGKEVIYTAGTDEHGGKIAEALCNAVDPQGDIGFGHKSFYVIILAVKGLICNSAAFGTALAPVIGEEGERIGSIREGYEKRG